MTSVQCQKILEIVKHILDTTSDKVVVVSQWTSFLNITGSYLSKENVRFTEFTGKTHIKLRNEIAISFNQPESPIRVSCLYLLELFAEH